MSDNNQPNSNQDNTENAPAWQATLSPYCPGAWFHSYDVTTIEGTDYYNIVTLDGSASSLNAPTGTIWWQALQLPGPNGVPVVVPPDTATNFQIRAALMDMPGPSGGTMYDAVNVAVHAQGGVALQAWEYANEVNRSGPLVQQMAARFGFDEASLDALFIAAAGISA